MKIIAIGRNYIEHAKELNNPVPVEPIIFLKPDTALLRNNQPFFYPDFSKEIHYETEIVLKISKIGKCILEKFADRYFTEITVGIDFTARDLQNAAKAKGLPWTLSKGFDGSAPIGQFVDKSELGDLKNLSFWMKLNDQLVQEGNTKDMIFSFEQIIAYTSNFCSFKIGDLVYTGTPAGVGAVKIGDRIQAGIGSRILLDFEVK